MFLSRGLWMMPLGRFLAEQRLLQREHALRPLEVVEAQAPVDDGEEILGALAGPGLARRHHQVLLQARERVLRRGAGEAGVHRRADGIDVAPRTEDGVV